VKLIKSRNQSRSGEEINERSFEDKTLVAMYDIVLYVNWHVGPFASIVFDDQWKKSHVHNAFF
jgi:hypothetical protein